MASNNPPRRALDGGIGSLGREELITLARAVCGQAAAFAGGHGNIHPENIFVSADGSPWLGERAKHAPGEWTTDELEYMAPELFWYGEGDERADVYSVGLMLYAGVTRGRLPFFTRPAADMTNELRAAALRRRMNGEAVPIPTIAGEKLGAVLRKALEFDPQGRYADTVELSMALEACVGEGDAAARAMFGKPERELSDVERTMAGILASYNSDDTSVPEPAEPEPEAPEIPEAPDEAAGEAAPDPYAEFEAAIRREFELDAPEAPDEAPAADAPAPEETPHDDAPAGEAPAGEIPADTEPPADEEPPAHIEAPAPSGGRGTPRESNRAAFWFVIGICAAVTLAVLALNFLLPHIYPSEPKGPATPSAPVQTAAPTPSSTPSPTPSPTPTPTPTPDPRYGIVAGDYSWTEAEQRAREMGGHLAVIDDAAELEAVSALAGGQGLDYLWIGFYRRDGAFYWVDNSAGYYAWAPGEPSTRDTDGTLESYGLLMRTDSGWLYNDTRNDLAALYPAVYSGNIGFLIEYDAAPAA